MEKVEFIKNRYFYRCRG